MDYQEAAPTHGRPNRHALFLVGESVTPTVRHDAWRAAYDRVLIALAAGSPIVALVGPTGVGKTTLLAEIAVALQRQDGIRIARRVALVDNADRLDDAALRGVFDGKTECAVFAGGPDFASRLRRMGADPAIVGLAPLRESEVHDFTTSLVETAGQEADLVSLGATQSLFTHSGGIPRRLSALARVAALVAYSQGATRIEPAHVERAAGLRDAGVPPARPPMTRQAPQTRRASFAQPARPIIPPRRPSLFAPVMMCFAAIAGVTFLWWQDEEPAEPAPAALYESVPALTRVIMQYSDGSAAAEAKAARLTETLRARGIATSDPAPAPSRPGTPDVGFFFSEDQTAAAAIERALAGQVGTMGQILRPPTSHPPQPGTIAVFVADDRPGNAADHAPTPARP